MIEILLFFWWCAHQICLCSLKSVSQYPYEKYNLLNCNCQVIHEDFFAVFVLFSAVNSHTNCNFKCHCCIYFGNSLAQKDRLFFPIGIDL